ncbi:MAG: ABC transporter substrate-binding protein [Chloroflexales bacterium]|nr:ABC transporter substrate-binding protein [Chloroflexales bacterium]
MADRHEGARPHNGAMRVGIGMLAALLLAACGTPASSVQPQANADPAAGQANPAAAPEANPAAGDATPGVTDTEIVLGSWGPQDGPAGAYGVINRTHAAYFQMINEQGGIGGRQIRFVYENDSYQPAKTVAAVKKLVEEEQIFALLGGLGTPNNMAVMEYIVQSGVPHIAPSTGSTLMSNPFKRNVFALQLDYTTEAQLIAQYALDTLQSEKIAVFYQNDAFGKEGFDNVNAVLKRRGLPEATGVTYEVTDTNFSAQALRLQTSDVDTVVLWAVPKPGGAIIQEMDKIGFKPKMLSSTVINDPAIFELAGPGIEGLIISAWLPDFNDTSNPKIVEYREFMQQYAPGEQIGGFSLTAYAQGQVVSEALWRAGADLTRESLIAALESMQDYDDSVVPSVSYGPDDRQGTELTFFQEAKGGVFIPISDFIGLESP